MGELLPIPRSGDVFTDARGGDRAMRVSWHAESGMVVVSLWAGRLCRASFRLPAADVPRLLGTLATAASETAPPAVTATGGPAGTATEPSAMPQPDRPATDPPDAPPMAHAC
jgi:hypothetical protein